MSCVCGNSQLCASTSSNCSECIVSVGYSLLPGSARLITYTAPEQMLARISVAVISGAQPNNFSVIVNGNQVAQISGSGGVSFYNLNQGDQVIVQANWGFSYWGGTFMVQICPENILPTPTPPPSSSQTYLQYVVYALLAVLAVLVIYYLMQRRKIKQST